jgi:Cd2+/Zn2+-exporting ATPase
MLVKGGAFLESGCKLRVLALDKTGTLTEGRPVVSSIRSLSTRSVAEVTQLLASLEAHSEHPLAGALVKEWSGSHLEVEEFAALPGWGVRGRIAGKVYQAGSRRLLPAQDVPEATSGTTTVYLLEGDELVGVAELRDQVRVDASEALAALRAQGIRTVMLTGDSPEAAAAVASVLALDEVRAGLLPEEKLKAIEELSRLGPVAMVGDGINDAPALARASLGFAMGKAGTAVALETADVALMNDRLANLPHFVRLSRRTRAILIQNIVFALVVKLVFCLLTAFGYVSLWMAILADMGSCLLVIANGLRLLRFPALPALAPKVCCSKTCCSVKIARPEEQNQAEP